LPRSQLIKLHLYVAAFLVPMLFIMSLSGILDLLDIEGEVIKTQIYSTEQDALDFKSLTLHQDVRKILRHIKADTDFTKIKIKKNKLYTYPNYTRHYAFKKKANRLNIYEYIPSLQWKLMALHKGNGPAIYKIYQQVFVYGLFFVLLSGLWLGLTTPALRSKTLLVFLAGIVFYLFLVNL